MSCPIDRDGRWDSAFMAHEWPLSAADHAAMSFAVLTSWAAAKDSVAHHRL